MRKYRLTNTFLQKACVGIVSNPVNFEGGKQV
jgi:hypothetical protein